MEKRSIRNTPEDPEIATRPGWQGTHVWWLISKLETGADQITLSITEFPPGKVHEVHRHPNCEEIGYVLKGRCLHLSDGKPVRLEEGEAVFIEQGQWHGFANDTDEPTTLITVYGGVGGLEEAGYDPLGSARDTGRPGAGMKKLAVDTVAPDTTLADDGGWIGMTVRWIFTEETAGASRVTLNVTSFEPGGAHELHRHPGCEELLYILEGGGTCLMEAGQAPITQGEVCFVPRGEWHGFRNDTDRVTRVVCCYGGAGSLERAGYELLGRRVQ